MCTLLRHNLAEDWVTQSSQIQSTCNGLGCELWQRQLFPSSHAIPPPPLPRQSTTLIYLRISSMDKLLLTLPVPNCITILLPYRSFPSDKTARKKEIHIIECRFFRGKFSRRSTVINRLIKEEESRKPVLKGVVSRSLQLVHRQRMGLSSCRFITRRTRSVGVSSCLFLSRFVTLY